MIFFLLQSLFSDRCDRNGGFPTSGFRSPDVCFMLLFCIFLTLVTLVVRSLLVRFASPLEAIRFNGSKRHPRGEANKICQRQRAMIHKPHLDYFWALFALLALPLEVHAEDDGSSSCTNNENGECQWSASLNEPSCTLFMAESLIPGAGLGIFNGNIERNEGDVLGRGDVIIPLVDFTYHMTADYKFNTNYHFDPTANYVWDGREFGLQYETAFVNHGMSAFAPGLDCAINCHLGLINVDKTPPLYETGQLHRSKDPGVGAFTPYHNSSTIVTAYIPPGGEVFKSYGDDYFLSRKKLELVPVWDDYPQAEEFVGLFNKLWDDHLTHLSPTLMSDLWELVAQFPLRSRVFNALPQNMVEFEKVMLEGIRSILQPHYTRGLDYLEQHGRCVDHIASGPSTLRQAGRGAFAARPLAKGQVITGSPVIWYPNGDFFRMYEGNWSSQVDPPDIENQVNTQIIMNYCWTHQDSSLYLCPYGPGVQYINHNKSLANIKVEWAKDGEMGHKSSLLEKHPDVMFPIASPGLTLDFIATRDIVEGEELFLDYGDEWESAWKKHVAAWSLNAPPSSTLFSSTYQSAREWELENPHAMLRTVKEQSRDPYPPHFAFRCLKEVGAYEMNHEEARGMWEMRTAGLPCTIQQRKQEENGQFLYIVHFLPDSEYESGLEDLNLGPDEDGQLWWLETDWIVREAIKVIDAPYTTDLHLREAFRHPIGISDHLFPSAWKGYETSGIW